jgi:hypothetical protein
MTGILLIHYFVVGAAFGKCPYKEYEIAGVVQEEKTGQVIAGAKLYFFFDDLQRTLTYGYETRYPDFFKTNDRGAFLATVYFDSYSGFLITDRCNKKPTALTVIIIAEGYPARRMEYKIKKLLSTDSAIKLPPIALYKPIEK